MLGHLSWKTGWFLSFNITERVFQSEIKQMDLYFMAHIYSGLTYFLNSNTVLLLTQTKGNLENRNPHEAFAPDILTK
jgi:hypothetical protein